MVTDQAFAELGLAPDASAFEIKAAWRRLASRWHPDRNASAQAVAQMQRINQAFEAIQRARDNPDDTPTPEPEAEPAAPAPDTRPAHPPIRRKLKLTLEEAAAGCIKPLRGKFTPACSPCEGLGHRVLGSKCRRCRGSGSFTRPSAWFGWPGRAETCEDCAGTGVARETCSHCGGSGNQAEQSYEVQARIPPGVREGDLLHVAARRAPADLEVQVGIAPHPFFMLQGDGELHCRVPVDGFAWMANRSMQVPTPDGQQPLALRRDQQRYRLAGHGFPARHGGPRGDLVVDIAPIFPEQLGTDQQILLDQLIASNASREPRLAAWQQALHARTRQRKKSKKT